ncbi:aspartate aminotransferase family protein [Parapedomonas caeni]
MSRLAGIDPARLAAVLADERDRFLQDHPKAASLATQSAEHWLGGVPMHWMNDWASPVPLYARDAAGAVIHDVDGHRYDDFCLGDTPSMYGHAVPAITEALSAQLARGSSFMLPTEDVPAVGRLLAARFGLPVWQMATTASDANRAAIRWARALTGRSQILVFDGCYHGAVDDAYVVQGPQGARMKPGLVGQVHDMTATTRVVAFNDIAALEAALADGAVAAVLAEPAMTNCGMILPDDGFHDALRTLTRRYGTLLILDETHTISTGPGGYTGAFGLAPDMLTLGKPIAGGIPAAVWGMTADIADRIRDYQRTAETGSSGIGTTLSGNALAVAGMRAMLEQVMTPAAYAHMRAMTVRLVDALEAVITRHGLPWSTVNVGARVELVLARPAPRDAAAMRASLHGPLLDVLHLGLINRGVLIAPFHMMMLLSPATLPAQVDRLAAAVDDIAALLLASNDHD